MKRVLILGGYGNFGSWIARSLASEPELKLLIAGRSRERAQSFANSLTVRQPAEGHAIDIRRPLDDFLGELRPDMVIHAVGPFQGQGHGVAEACIRQRCHYLDLADARSFVAGIRSLDKAARMNGVLVVSGASSVPCLTAAVVDEALPRFSRLEELDYGISASQQTNRGLATASSALSYVGRPFTVLRRGTWQRIFGWQDLHAERYPELGWRLFGNCDVPDLELFPERYPHLKSMRFCAGHEIKLLHLGAWLLSWAVRSGVLQPLSVHAERLLKFSFLFDPIGSDRSGFHMIIRGLGADGRKRDERLFIIARSGHGPLIPCVPAILLAKRLARGKLGQRGALPGLDLIALHEYLDALADLDIHVIRLTP